MNYNNILRMVQKGHTCCTSKIQYRLNYVQFSRCIVLLKKYLSNNISVLGFSFIALLCLPTLSYAGLSAVTANTIQGSKPYLSTSYMTVLKNGTDLDLLSFKTGTMTFQSSTDITDAINAAGVSFGQLTPDSLQNSMGGTFFGVVNQPAMLDMLDNDGDSFDATALQELNSGSLIVDWYYKNGSNEVSLSPTQKGLNFCQLAASGITPYLKVEGPLKLSTQYGDPIFQIYDKSDINSPLHTSKGGGGKNPVRRFNVDSGIAELCSAKPDVKFGDGRYAGPAGMWDPISGFLKQSDTNYSQNFPTTGANKLYFDLVIIGINAKTLTWGDAVSPGIPGKVIVNDITATMNPTKVNSVRVTLTGPFASAEQITANSPSPLTIPVLPAQIVLEGKNSGLPVLTYGFEIKNWFVHTGTKGRVPIGPVSQTSWCNDLGYRIVRVNDLTNASGGAWIGATPASPGDRYQRRINSGFFTEWGFVYNYLGAAFPTWQYGYWTGDSANSYYQFAVHAHGGGVFSDQKNFILYSICVTL